MKLEQPINILVRRRAAIGDTIMSTAVVRELTKRYNNCNIDIATEFVEVYRNNPHIRNIYLPHMMPDVAAYDLYINLDDAYELNPTQHYVDSMFYRAFGDNFRNLDQRVELWPSEEDRREVVQDMEDLGQQFIVVHMRQWHWASKNISLDTWFEVFSLLFEQRTDFTIVCVGGDTDFAVQDHPLIFDARGRYNSQQLKYLCDHAQAFVGIDSGPFQCAAASNTHIIALLTHLRPECILPYRKHEMGHNCTAIQTSEDCAGCNDDQVRPVRQLVCKKQTFPCASNWDTQRIANTILGQLK
jgi:ADP-heptose:LPS heptosyltransferase